MQLLQISLALAAAIGVFAAPTPDLPPVAVDTASRIEQLSSPQTLSTPSPKVATQSIGVTTSRFPHVPPPTRTKPTQYLLSLKDFAQKDKFTTDLEAAIAKENAVLKKPTNVLKTVYDIPQFAAYDVAITLVVFNWIKADLRVKTLSTVKSGTLA